MAKNTIDRTVQYWRLVDASTHDPLENDIDWNKFFEQIIGLQTKGLHSKIIDGRNLSGLITPLKAESRKLLADECPLSRNLITDCQDSYGVVIAADKDFVPNQHDSNSGKQAPVGTNQGWNAVDNSFLWHLPFGNIFAYVNESNSSVRATKYADWLTDLMRSNGWFAKDPNFRLTVAPVLDKEARKRIGQAVGLKKVIVRTSVGKKSSKNASIGKMFARGDDYEYVEIETNIHVKRGKSDVADQAELLNWFNENVGALEDFDKAKVNLVDAKENTTEVDLIEQRITRKQGIQLVSASAGANIIDETTVFPAIIRAFNRDAKVLDNLKDDGR